MTIIRICALLAVYSIFAGGCSESDPGGTAPEVSGGATTSVNPGAQNQVGAKAAPAANNTNEQSVSGSSLPRPNAGKDFDKDVVGLRLGMTIAEVKLTIGAHDSRMQIAEITSPIPRLDSESSTIEMDKFTSEIVAQWTHFIKGFKNDGSDVADKITVVFSPPPSEQKAVLIDREITYSRNSGPAKSVLVGALAEKYGDSHSAKELSGTLTQLWFAENPNYSDMEALYYSNYIRSLQTANLQTNGRYLRLSGLRLAQLPVRDPGPALKVTVVAPKESVFQVNSVLMESLMNAAASSTAFSERSQALYEKQKAELLEKASQKTAPKL